MNAPLPGPAEDRAPLPALAGVVAVARFQLSRLVTPPRLLLALLGASFPVAVLLAARNAVGARIDERFGIPMLYALIPEAVCMLGLLVTMCPLVADELERGTWVHVAVRPGGRRSLLLGTWLAAVVWTGAVALLALVLALAAGCIEGQRRLLGTFSLLVVLSCVGRAALFSLPAVIVPKRALVASVGVALGVEYLAGFVPAVINQFTVSLRLRTLLVAWLDLRKTLPAEVSLLLVDDRQPGFQVAAVLGLAALLLGASWAILEWRQFPPSEES